MLFVVNRRGNGESNGSIDRLRDNRGFEWNPGLPRILPYCKRSFNKRSSFAGTETVSRKHQERLGRVEMHAVRTPRTVLLVVLLVAACMAPLIPGATAQTSPLERGASATNETSPLKKAGSPHDR